MKILRWIFLSMFVYGLWSGMLGAGLLALGMWAFVCYAEGVFAAADRAHANSPRSAGPAQQSTSDALADHDCECMRSRF